MCLRFGLWMTLRTDYIYLLTNLLCENQSEWLMKNRFIWSTAVTDFRVIDLTWHLHMHKFANTLKESSTAQSYLTQQNRTTLLYLRLQSKNKSKIKKSNYTCVCRDFTVAMVFDVVEDTKDTSCKGVALSLWVGGGAAGMLSSALSSLCVQQQYSCTQAILNTAILHTSHQL